MRAARLIRMVLLLQARPGMTAAELSRELGVSERTVTRDAGALSDAGIPVYAERGRAGGYRLVGGYRTGLTGLARDEAEALFLSGLPSALREMGLADAASAARLKVSAALTPALRDAPAGAGRRFHLDAPGWYQEPVAPELLPAVADAVRRDRLLLARYRRPGRDTGPERELAPYGLVLKAGVWYLCARVDDGAGDGSRTDGGFRVYRVDRFTAVTDSGIPFVRDEGFDLPTFWEERAAAFARSLLRAKVRLRLSPEAVRRLPQVVDRAAAGDALESAGPPDGDGWVAVTLAVESPDVAYGQLLGLGPELEVLEPAALRERFARAAARLHALYGDTP
ncbi:helix-turn-helix transcriptional regulator [Streptomyces sp. NBC_00525]|uniref:helix-turn-helix transcriptional regulator n=1 Tax=Streptomyces sp. NBC_00525 TaxID=2903660 RepID=UPI002E804F31|nr:WYL domain-containing protein [Streptomyces sp. NBC_00525]WUC93319.1 WYL domain-containing protein [Streptomyces sp. NBC_00525]